MNTNYKVSITILLLMLGVATQTVIGVDSSKLNEVRENIASQAEAIKQLTETAYSIQAKLGGQVGGVELEALNTELQKIQNQAGGAQEINTLLETAKIQSKVLNQLADLVVRLQHQVGIQPEGAEALMKEGETQQGQQQPRAPQ